ncbi:hypothetical protein HOY80DRAFT_905718, partial [Tuber brumale]
MTKVRDTPRKGKEPAVSRPKEPEIGGSNYEDLEEYPTDFEDQPCIPLIFVMGVSGAGKSSFIKTLEGKDSEEKPPVTSASESVTREVEVYKTILDGQEMLLVDTPGFEDNKASNLETIQKICEYILQVANNPACIIHGAIYVHNIATSRWIAGDERTWSILKTLCGDAAMGNVIVATTRWPADHKDEDYEELERRNLENYWEGILGTVRLAKNDVQHSRTAIRKLFSVRPKPFLVQWELSSGNTPSDTSAGRSSMAEGEEALSKAEEEKEYALAELRRVSLQVEPVPSQNAIPEPTRPPPPETEPSAANLKKEMDDLLHRIGSAVHASKLQVEKIKGSEKTLQEEIQQVQASLKEKEDLLKKYHQLRRKIESADKLKARLSALRTPISSRKILAENLLAMVLAGGAVVLDIGSTSFPFFGFAALGGLLLYKRAMSKNANPKPQKAIQTPSREYQIPTMNIEEGAGLNDGSDGNGERIERRRAGARTKASKMKTTKVEGGSVSQEPPLLMVQRRSSWSSI